MVKDEYNSWVQCFAWTEQEKVTWLLKAAAHVERQLLEKDAEIASLKERLEIGFAFDIHGNRIPWPEDGIDGIYCRDQTIKGLDERVQELKAEIKLLKSTNAQNISSKEEP